MERVEIDRVSASRESLFLLLAQFPAKQIPPSVMDEESVSGGGRFRPSLGGDVGLPLPGAEMV